MVSFVNIDDEGIYISPLSNKIALTQPLTEERQLVWMHCKMFSRVFLKPMWI